MVTRAAQSGFWEAAMADQSHDEASGKQDELALAVVSKPSTELALRAAQPPSSVAIQQAMKIEFTHSMLAKLELEVQSGEKARSCLEAEIAKQRGVLGELNIRIAKLAEDCSSKDAKLLECQRQLARVKEDERAVKAESKSLQEEKAKITQNLEECMEKLQKCQSLLQQKTSEVHTVIAKFEATQARVLAVEDKCSAFAAENDELTKSFKAQEEKCMRLSAAMLQKDDEISSLRYKLSSLKAEFSALEGLNSLTTANCEKVLDELKWARALHHQESEAREALVKKEAEMLAETRSLHEEVMRLKLENEGLAQREVASREALAKAKEHWDSMRTSTDEETRETQSKLQVLVAEKTRSESRAEELQRQLDSMVQQMEIAGKERDSEISNLKEQLAQMTDEKQLITARVSELEAGKLQAETLCTKASSCMETQEAELAKLRADLQSFAQKEVSLQQQIKGFEDKLAIANKLMEDMKVEHKKSLEAKKLELHSYMREIQRKNGEAMAEMQKQFEAEATRSVDKERKKVQALLEESQQRQQQLLADEKEKYSSRIKLQMEKHAAGLADMENKHTKEIEDLKALHAEALQRTAEERRRALEHMESELGHKQTLIDELKTEVKTRDIKLADVEKGMAAALEGAAKEHVEAKEAQIKEMESQMKAFVAENQQLSESLSKMQAKHHAQLQEMSVKLAEANRKLAQQHSQDQETMHHVQQELEKSLRDAQTRADGLERKLLETKDAWSKSQKEMQGRHEEKMRQAEEAFQKLQDELARQRAEAAGEVNKTKMQRDNMVAKLMVEHEDALKKLQAEHESSMKRKELDFETSLKQLKLEHENSLASLKMDHATATRKFQLDQLSGQRKVEPTDTKCHVDAKRKALLRKPKLQPMTSSDNEEVFIKPANRGHANDVDGLRKKRPRQTAGNSTRSHSTVDPEDDPFGF